MIQKLLVLLTLLVVMSPVRAENDTPIPALLTVSSATARFGGSPFDTTEWVAELGQLDTVTLSHRVLLPLWGADAPAYAAQVTSMAWSPLGKRLALSLVDTQGAESILLYNARKYDFELLLSPKDGLTRLSSLSWSPDTKFFVFSALDMSGVEQIFEIKIPGFEVKPIIEGRLPAISPDGKNIAYIAPDGGLYLLTIESHETEFISRMGSAVSAISWQGNTITVAVGGKISTLEVETRQFKVLYEFAPESGEDVTISSIAWSRRTLVFVLNVREYISQILALTDGQVLVLAERRYTSATLPDDARIFLSAVFQPPGAFLYGGGGGDL